MLTQHKEMARLCVGCGVCLGLCPMGAIKLKAMKGVLTVNFDYSRCNKCEICIRACPVLFSFYGNDLRIDDMLGKIEKMFFGYSADHKIRYHGASGGVVTTLALYMLRHRLVDKVLVVRMKKFTAEPLLTSSEYDVMSAQGSIYFKTFSLRLAQKLLYYLKKGKKLCVIGLPCHISALKRMLRSSESNLYFIGLVCSHVNEIWYLKYIVRKYLPKNASLIAIGPRKDSWPGVIKMLFKLNENLREGTISLSDFWEPIPWLNISSPLGCMVCMDHLAYMADIIAGDAWHPKFRNDPLGVSILIIRTTKGLKLMERIIRDRLLHVEKMELQDLLVSHGHHLIEESRYAPFRRKLVQHRFTSLRELMELDKLVVALLIIINRITTRSEVAMRFLETFLTKKFLRIASSYMYRVKARILARVCEKILKGSLE